MFYFVRPCPRLLGYNDKVKPYSSYEKPAAAPSESEDEQIDEQLDISLFGSTKKEKEQDKEHEAKKIDAKEAKHKKDKKEKEQQNEEKAVKKPEKPKEEDPEVKRRKRATLVERSFYYKKHYQEVPIPRNPWIIARLMVAEHILAIHGQIEQPVTHENATDELTLLATLDYMGVIADKLENPETESTPEVDETVETIIQLAAETLEEGDENIARTVITANADTAHIQSRDDSETPDQPELPVNAHRPALSPIAAALISAIQHIRKDGTVQVVLPTNAEVSPEDNHIHTTRPTIGLGGGTSSRPGPPTTIPHREASVQPTSPSAIDTFTPTTTSSLEVPGAHRSQVRHETFSRPSHRSAEPLAALAVATALATPRATEQRSAIHEYAATRPLTPQSNARERPITAAPHSPRDTHQTEIYRPQPQPIHKPVYAGPVHETRPSVPAPIYTEPTYSSRELEHMRIEPLLRLAENVPIGHGQRLRRAYEKGFIDKEGLVKILKSRAKNHDFLHEYSQQVTKQRNLVQTSPEFLHPAPSKDNQFVSNQKNEPAQDTDTNSTSPSAAPVRPAALPAVKPAQQTPVDDPISIPEVKTSRSSWLIIILVAVLSLVVLVLFLFFLV